MSASRNKLANFVEAADAAARYVRLQRDLILLEQELKTLRQIKRGVWLAAGVISFNLMLTLTVNWILMELYSRGWRPYALALISFLFFGALVALSFFASNQIGKPHGKKTR